MIDTKPTICNLCGGEVIFTSNSRIYGKEYGSGKCYLCTSCGAYVGTHKPRPQEAMGLLADYKMRELKKACHGIFDKMWKNRTERRKCYERLAKKMNIPISECHFGYFNLEQLNKAYEILKEKEREEN